jgi:hypothetical protein
VRLGELLDDLSDTCDLRRGGADRPKICGAILGAMSRADGLSVVRSCTENARGTRKSMIVTLVGTLTGMPRDRSTRASST